MLTMSFPLLSQNILETSYIDDMQRLSDEKTVALYSRIDYRNPHNLYNVDIAYYDARTNRETDVAPLMHRYHYASYSAHPSVLINNLAPSYYVIFADDVQARQRVLEALTKQKEKKSSTKIVILYTGKETLDTDIVKRIDALYTLPSGSPWAFDLLTQAFWGGIEVGINASYSPYARELVAMTSDKIRIAYSSPSHANMDLQVLDSIDIVMKKMIQEEAAPGGVVLVARNGRVVFERSYGHTTYKSRQRVTKEHIYDIASLSKVVGTLPLAMKYNTLGIISASDTLGEYLRLPKDKSAITIEELLLHQSGLKSSLPYFMLCIDSTSINGPLYSRYRRGNHTIQIEQRLYMLNNLMLKKSIFSTSKGSLYNVEVSKNMFTTDSFRLSLYDNVDNSKLLDKRYRYSDLSFIYLQRVLETLSGESLDEMFRKQIAEPLGLVRMCYHPLERFTQDDIVPTETDKFFRKHTVWGTVHDQTCALLGGVAGHAGVFSTAGELAKVGQLFLNGGSYGGVSIFSPQVAQLFTRRHRDDNRRGYGFDKPEFRDNASSPVTDGVPLSSYGHTGFTGTMLWIDPDNELIYIFLSNRVCPDTFNNKLSKLNIRSDIHAIIYRAIKDIKTTN